MLATALAACSGVAAFALDPSRPVRSLNRQAWDTESGLPQNTIHSVIQTPDGYIWLATDGGLVRFNGSEFVVFDRANTPALKSDHIRNLFLDAAGDLWISTAGGLLRKSPEASQPFTPQSGLPDDDVSFVTQQGSGDLWIVTATGVSRFKDGKVLNFPVSGVNALANASDGSVWLGNADTLVHIQADNIHEQLPVSAVRAMCVDRSGSIWVGTRETVSVLTPAGTLQAVPGNHIRDVTAMLCDRDGRVWIGATDGLALMDHGKVKTFSAQDGLPGQRIHSIHQDALGAVWVSTNRGLVRIVKGAVSGVVSTNVVLSMVDDREGNLWLGTDADGLAILRDRKFVSYTTEQGLPDDRVSAIFQDPSGTVWVGTKESGLSAERNGVFKNYTSANGLASDIILALAGDATGRVWIGTPDGLNIFDHGKFSLLTSADGLADDFVRSLYQDSTGAMWIGTRRGLSRFQAGQVTNYSTADGLPSDFIGALLDDREHGLWIGTLRGLSRFQQGKFTNYSSSQGLTSEAVTSLHQDSRGQLWVGTDGGLFRLNGRKIFSYAKRPELPQMIYAIVEDDASYLWLASPKGIFRVARSELDAIAEDKNGPLNVSAYGTADGMRTRECTSGAHPAAWRMQDGSLWFSTLKGVASVQPNALPVNTVPPPVAVERIIVDDVAESPSSSLAIAAGHSRLSFQYAAMSYTAPEKVRFKYKLEGVDRDWVETSERKSATYTNLRPGNYIFHVIAANNDGVWSMTAADLGFRLKPAFYQTLWFYALCALCAGLLAYQIYGMRIRYVRSRFSAVLEERQRIAREIHDTLAQGFVGISVQLELISKLLSAAPEQAREHLDQTRRLVRDSIAEARRSIWNLRATEETSLPAALAASAARLSQGTQTEATVNVSGTYHPLPKTVEEELLKVAQEAITNAIRHANAKHVNVELLFGSAVRLTVRDDGRGFDAQAYANGRAGHYGLTGMRERAEKIRAELTIESRMGEGTEIKLEAELRTLEGVQV